jgi:soluble lytic murein transglycosylase-like protein
MSAATLSAPVGPSDATAAAQRVQQLQALLAQAQQGGSTAGFAAALQAASAGESSETQIPGASETASGLTTSAATSTPATAGATGLTAGTAELTADTTGTGTSGIPMSPTGYTAPGAPGAATTPATATAIPPAGSSASTPYDATIAQVAARYNIDPAILHGLIQQESGFDPNSHSSAGALGLTQLMPGTASSLGVTNPLDPTQSIEGGARYLSEMLSKFGGNVSDALAAYNAGPGAVSQYGGVPPYPETQEYVNKVLGYANAYQQSLSSTAAPTSVSTPSPTGSIA